MYKESRKSWIKHVDFTIVDLVCVIGSFYLAYFVYVYDPVLKDPYLHDLYQRLSIIVVLLYIALVFFTEAYTGVLRRGYLKEAFAVLKINIYEFLAVLAYLYATKQTYIVSRVMLALFLGFSVIFCTIGRWIIKKIVIERMKRESVASHMLVVAMKENVESVLRGLKADHRTDRVIDGVVVIDCPCKGEVIEGIPVVAMAEDMYQYAGNHVIDEVFINGSDTQTLEKAAEVFLEMGITVHVNLIRITQMMPNRLIERCGNFMVLTTSMRVAGPRQMFIKRALDIVGSIVGLIICGIACIIFAPIIKIQSPGPVFYKQKRVGKNGRRFDIYKFRTMYVGADQMLDELKEQNEMEGPMFKMENDPRIFPIGHFMRRFSIDELPQFWNVLRGSMSLVGTRPPTVDEYEQYDLPHRARLGSKPGITGLWQVSGRNQITDFEEVVRLDTQYISEWTLGEDIKILLKTVQIVFSGRGAC